MSIAEVRAAIATWFEDIDSEVDYAALSARFWRQTTLDEWKMVGDMGADVLWSGMVTGKGYSVFTIKGTQWYAHRVAVRIGLDGVCAPRVIPQGLTVDHVRDRGCGSRACVLPTHLEVVTRGTNGRRTRNMNVFT